jgi:hypothetical protein
MKYKNLIEYQEAIEETPDNLELIIDCANHCYNESMVCFSLKYYSLVLEKNYHGTRFKTVKRKLGLCKTILSRCVAWNEELKEWERRSRK